MPPRKKKEPADAQNKPSYEQLEQRVMQLENENRLLEEANRHMEEENAELRRPTNSREIAQLQYDLSTAHLMIRERDLQLAREKGANKNDKLQLSDKPEDIVGSD
jgi:hypothetical protein